MGHLIKTTCLINSYNYRPFVGEAVDSVLGQSRAVDQIVIVDDGSTDGSSEFLAQAYSQRPSVELVTKENGGQLSCFNRGIQAVSGDIVFFLDADDRFRPDYVSRAVAFYERNRDVDFLAVGEAHFGSHATSTRPVRNARDLGISTLAALFARQWVGGVTSTLSMRTALARRVLPFPYEESWMTRADDVLVYGASVLGAHKYRLGELLVDYRVHGHNRFIGRKPNAADTMRYSLAVNQMLAWYARQMGFDLQRLPRLLHREFRTLQRPTSRELRSYLGMAWSLPIPFSLRLRQSLAMLAHMVRQRNNRATLLDRPLPLSTRTLSPTQVA